VVAAGPPGIIASDPKVLDAYLGAALDDGGSGGGPVPGDPGDG
jgi:hypothetical protein